jgi:hypothetical protein
MKLKKLSAFINRKLFIGLLLLLQACFPDPEPDNQRSDAFSSIPSSVQINPGIVDEASGLAMSVNMDGYLWTHQDSGQPNSLYLVSKDGQFIREYNVSGTLNHDWEDIAQGKGPREGVSYLYIADIGNNNSPMTATNTIYRIPEIGSIEGQFNPEELEKIVFRYPDGPVDAEAIIVDPLTRDIFILSKEMIRSVVYKLAYPQSTTEINMAEKVGVNAGVFMATGADISSDGAEVLIRNYATVYHMQKNKGESLEHMLTRTTLKTLKVAFEPQGEAICFDRTADGFFTLSERSNAASVFLNYYLRN